MAHQNTYLHLIVFYDYGIILWLINLYWEHMLLQQATLAPFWPDNFTNWTTALGAIATVGTLLFLAYQIHQQRQEMSLNKEDMDLKYRPWVGISHWEYSKQTDEKRILTIFIKNFGTTPARNIRFNYYISTRPINIDDKNTINKKQVQAMLSPDQIFEVSLLLSNSIMSDVISGKSELYILTSISYNGIRKDNNIYTYINVYKYTQNELFVSVVDKFI